ncbi:hypothetical protein [Candidatus Protochlamydia sp. W-9]|uniref:hypothetical protein n=1 Tax=Candidatus Protochlamydia sp. W-9 TaxID=1785087 RepID=UPI00096AA374|nr:hypothetical protein [Candidatus Protochlamydia sp. W-9]
MIPKPKDYFFALTDLQGSIDTFLRPNAVLTQQRQRQLELVLENFFLKKDQEKLTQQLTDIKCNITSKQIENKELENKNQQELQQIIKISEKLLAACKKECEEHAQFKKEADQKVASISQSFAKLRENDAKQLQELKRMQQQCDDLQLLHKQDMQLLGQLNEQVQKIKESFHFLGQEYKQHFKDFQLLRQQFGQIRKDLELIKNQLDYMRKDLEDIRQDFKRLKEKMNSLTQDFRVIRAEIEELDRREDISNKAIADRLEKMQVAFDQLAAQMNKDKLVQPTSLPQISESSFDQSNSKNILTFSFFRSLFKWNIFKIICLNHFNHHHLFRRTSNIWASNIWARKIPMSVDSKELG